MFFVRLHGEYDTSLILRKHHVYYIYYCKAEETLKKRNSFNNEETIN